jgi:hypothetical protein
MKYINSVYYIDQQTKELTVGISLASVMKISYEISNLTNLKRVSNSRKIVILNWPLS